MSLRVVFSGGATLGPVTPLLAVAEALRHRQPDVAFWWLGTTTGPEGQLVSAAGIPFQAIASGKLRRYVSWRNLIDPLFVAIGFFQSLYWLKKWRPDVVVSAGGFVAVPVSFAAWLLRIPVMIHQQDVMPGLSNRMIAPLARAITVALEESRQYFLAKKVTVVGNPVRASILIGDANRARLTFHLQQNLPTVLILGGGTGSLTINQAVVDALPELSLFCQIIHITGHDRDVPPATPTDHYHPFHLLANQLADAFAVADLVVSRAGFSTLSELAALAKPAIIIPLAGHQEANADYFARRNAVALMSDETLDGPALVAAIRQLLSNDIERQRLSSAIKTVLPTTTAAGALADVIFSLKSPS